MNTVHTSTNLNKVSLIGELTEEVVASHETKGVSFYKSVIEVKRNSGTSDRINLTIPSVVIEDIDSFKAGTRVKVYGEFRSRNFDNRLILEVYVKRLSVLEEEQEDLNIIDINGFICKEPVYRITPLGREICDLVIACNRGNGRSDYLPSIVWGRNAQFARECVRVGTPINVSGRVQSREYNKKTETGEVVKRVAYEISVRTINITQ